MIARVSHLEAFRRWRADEDADLDALLANLRGESPASTAMATGTAFHSALETAQPGETSTLHAEHNGVRYLFNIRADITIALPSIRELRGHKDYGPLRITGQVDALVGNRIDDHKTTGRFDPERYIEGYQWRFYLDLFGADRFRWNVFEIEQADDVNGCATFDVYGFHQLEQWRYGGLHSDCAKLVGEFYAFAEQVGLVEPKVAA